MKMMLVLAMLCAALTINRSATATTYVVEDGVIKLSAAAYEIGFREADGGIAYILDKGTNQRVSEGSANNDLWFAALVGNKAVQGSSYSGNFTHDWDAASSQLTLTYTAADSLNVKVTVDASSEQALRMQASVSNGAPKSIQSFRFPNALKIADADVTDALLPLMPGAQISPKFFAEARSYIDIYPGVMFADYLAVNTNKGQLAVYGVHGDIIQPALIGFQHDSSVPDYAMVTHNFRTWVDTGKTWTTPWVVIAVGKPYPDSIAAYRTDNGIDKYPALAEKLGDKAAAYFAAPMYKLDLQVLKQTFQNLQQTVISKVNFPGLVHLVAIQQGGHDNNYPDIMPPDKKWGTAEDFAAFNDAVHQGGGLVLPYVNLSWWDNNGQLLSKLPADVKLFDLIVLKDATKLPAFETYGPNGGFVMNLHHPFVQAKIAEQLDALKAVGVDGVFGDQWGNRAVPYDFNAAGLDNYDPATSYFGGIVELYYRTADSAWMTETGVDVLAEQGTGFMGTNYLWDMLGYRGATAGVTTYYPMAGMLLRDKVLLYQHNLAAETWTKNKDMLRWNLTYGYGLSNAFYDNNKGGVNMDNPWLNLIGVFQKYALANYADQQVVSYEQLAGGVRQTRFAMYTVYSNWDNSAPYTVNGNTLPPGGVVTQAKDGTVTAGVFSAYNGVDLSAGDHYLVETRGETAIKVFQPVGDDTPLTIKLPTDWQTAKIEAYGYDGVLFGAADAIAADGTITFTYKNAINGQTVGYYQIAP
ncbi:MAG: hypothetical protein KF716_05745 [Anaerolineae bacterium]|nr:hypothetical protein [Anaerolineae bacterium]